MKKTIFILLFALTSCSVHYESSDSSSDSNKKRYKQEVIADDAEGTRMVYHFYDEENQNDCYVHYNAISCVKRITK